MMFSEGGAFVVRRMNCDFLRPAKFDEVLTVESKPGEVAGARFEIKQLVLRGDDVLFTAEVTAVLIDGRGRPKRISPELLAAMTKATS
jgi:acyl-CoA thioester hydrolase